jgi:hypothetical protein
LDSFFDSFYYIDIKSSFLLIKKQYN